MFGFNTADISRYVNSLSDLRQIEVGEIVYFMPRDYDGSKLAENIRFLSHNKYNFEVRIAFTESAELYHYIGLRIVSLVRPYKEAYITACPEKRSLKALHDIIDDSLNYLAQAITEVDELPLITQIAHSQPISASYSTISFDTDPETDFENNLDREQQEYLKAISDLVLDYASRFKTMPPLDIIRKTVAGKLAVERGGFSKIKVTWDYKIILPELNNTELRMSPLAKAVYLLFLCHPEGIRLKDIADYRNQLREIYALIKPGADFELADSHIDDIAVAGSESLQQKLSMTRYAVKRAFLSPELAERYLIKGTPGEAYSINIPSTMIELTTSLKSILSFY
ncbi:MAG: hypothetical protein HDT08_05470 [Bacteroidales bacterium]|nr:hypothetical protein [Bacteroidales bacterium]